MRNAHRGTGVDVPMTGRNPEIAQPAAGQRSVQDLLTEDRATAGLRVESLTRQLDSVVESSAWTTHDDEHDPEGSTIAFERAQLQGQLDQARDDIDELDRAAERLEAGTYGFCESCGKGIAGQRLEALPAVRTCIDCATATGR